MFLIGPYSYPPGTMLSALQRLGLASGLKLCLDAGDIVSYDGTSQVWSDTSGGGYDFNRGSGSGSDAADPTFNGTAGRQSSGEYFSFDGGDYFSYDTTNETWMQNLHKDNALWAVAAWVYISSLAAPNTIISDLGAATTIGVVGGVKTSGKLFVAESNGGGAGGLTTLTSSASVSTGAWHFLAWRLDEAGNAATLQIDATQEDYGGAYTSPSASAATYGLKLGAEGDLFTFTPSGTRFNSISVWESSAPSKAQLLSLYNATSGRFA